MPHILVNKDHNKLSTPSNFEGVDFLFETQSTRSGDFKIGVTNQNKTFLLSTKAKPDGQLVKFDKPTRITPISVIQDSIKAYAASTQANVLFSNIDHNTNKAKPKDENLKDINYFVDEFDFSKTSYKEIWIEIGFGSGRHILHQAQNNPDVLLIGLEIHTPSIEQVLKQAKLLNLDNVYAVDYDARLFMEFLASNSVGRIFVHFPVPWDKKPHRRIYSHPFIKEALRVLKVDGTLELRTDSENYYEFCSELLSHYENVDIKKNQDLEVTSKYEDRWRKQGKNIYDLTLVAKEQSEVKVFDINFTFEKPINLQDLEGKLEKKPIVKKDFFIHFKDLFLSTENQNEGLLEISMGSFNAPVTKYVSVFNGEIKYFQGNPIPTSTNLKAHQEIKKILGSF